MSERVIPREAIEAGAKALDGAYGAPTRPEWPSRPEWADAARAQAETVIEAALPHLPGLSALTTEQLEFLLVRAGDQTEAVDRDWTNREWMEVMQATREVLRAELSRR